VIFAKEEELNQVLVKKINGTRKMYVSGTKWEGRSAVRVAVSTVSKFPEYLITLFGYFARFFFSNNLELPRHSKQALELAKHPEIS
jgi:hypothetical protein